MTAPRPMPHLDGVRHRYVNAGGLRMHIAEAGDPEADPVVLVHGWPQHWYAWRHLIGPLAADYRVICPDLRGFGWTDAPAGSYLKAELADDLIALLDALELPRVRMAGHDWGGYAGFLACLQAPERISHYLAAGIVHPWVGAPPNPLALTGQLIRLAYQPIVAAPVLGPMIMRRLPAFTRMVLSLSAAAAPWSRAELDQFASQWREPARAAACSALYRSFLVCEMPQLLRDPGPDRRLEVPSKLLVGERDPVITPETVHRSLEEIPNLSVVTLAGVGHWIPEEAPERMLAEGRELFAR